MTGGKFNRMIAVCKDKVSRYLRDTTATIAVTFAIMAPVIIGSAGMALDFAHAYLVQQRLAQAIDAAALAGAASSADATEIEQKIQQFFDANYPESKLGITFDPVVQVIGNEIHVTGNAYYDTFFLALIGITEIEVEADTTVMREVQGIEVVMVLDNTGSMATDNNILKLKEASKSFVEILFDRTTNPNFVRIGLVPYANSVRVGKYGLGQNPDGTTYADGVPFVNTPTGVTYTTDHSSANWYGCVVEHKETGYSATATHASGSKGQLWIDSAGAYKGHGWNPAVTTNDPYPDDVLDEYEGPWDPYMYGRVISSGQTCSAISSQYSNTRCSSCLGASSTCNKPNCFCWRTDSNEGTNYGCPYANLVPLTSDEEKLLEAIGDPTLTTSGMQAHGNTLGNIGMVWGARVLSPEFPFEEAHPWDDVYWKKAVVMMTDGVNTNDSNYSSFWFKNKNGLNTTAYNDRFKETCEALKEKDVIIYTITFTDGADGAKQDYEECASTPDKYYHVVNPDDLLPLFEQIARELSSLHIVD
ncbi:MAG TPA: hypothetical protein DEA55_03820 [Rhodospirillaceae bacterium]|nr:hypothetical protein [Rhodospirillaceae bacterium]